MKHQMETEILKAEVLIEAIPYIRRSVSISRVTN